MQRAYAIIILAGQQSKYTNKGEPMKKVIALMLTFAFSIGMLSAGTSAQAATQSSLAGTIATSSGGLNVRSAASSSSSVLTSLPKGSYVTLMSKSGNWWYVEYADGRYGYSHADYITPSNGSKAAVVNTSSGNLNVRSGASVSHAVTGSLPKGKTVIVLSESNGWSRVLYNGVKTGYVSSQYLKKAGASDAIQLNLPNFKQTDSRWANVLIGNSGKTIGRIGCTTTAIAMMESYRRGRTIYPDAMSKELSYSSSGDLYWPSDYTQTTNASGYLSRINELLRQKKPVLIGLKTKGGSQHWVVVTGFAGGDPTNASNYRINDPGSNSRSNLQQVINAYPVFYKLVYYR